MMSEALYQMRSLKVLTEVVNHDIRMKCFAASHKGLSKRVYRRNNASMTSFEL